MLEVNIQADHRDLSDAAITRRMRRTREGDEVVFNDRKESLTVVECSDDRRDWEVHFLAEDGTEVVELLTALTRANLEYEVGDEIDAWDPPYVVTDIIEHSSVADRDTNAPWLTLEGPQGGEYTLWHSPRGVKSRCTSGDAQAYQWGERVRWFQNRSRKRRSEAD